MEFGYYVLNTYVPELDGPAADLYGRYFEQIEAAEHVGFDHVWVTEHHFDYFGGMTPSPQMFLTAVSQRTRRLRLGTSVSILPLHHPLRIAEDFAVVDVLSGGRLEFGVGRGMPIAGYEGFGIPYAGAQERLKEAIHLIERLWREPRVTFQGRYYQCPEVTVLPRPVQQPHPPIWVGATATPDSFRWAGEHGYGIMTIGHLLDPAEIAERLALYREAYRAAGHPPGGERILGTYHAFVSPDRAEWEEVGRRGMTYYSRSSILAQELAVTKERGAAYAAHEPVLARMRALSFEDMVARRRVLIGEPAACRDTLAGLCEELGYTHVIFLFALGGLPYDAVLRAMDRFADEVLGLLPVA